LVEKYNRKYKSKEVMFNCERIPAENVGVKHAKWDKEDGYSVTRDCYNSYFYIVEDQMLNIIDKIRLHGNRYIKHLTGGSALHLNLEEYLSKEQYRNLFRVAASEGCNYYQTVAEVKVGWYSGKPALPPNFLLNDFQYVKLGPYIERLGGLNSKNTNQRLYRIDGQELIDITSCYWK